MPIITGADDQSPHDKIAALARELSRLKADTEKRHQTRRRFDQGAAIALGLAILGGVFWLGGMSSDVERLDKLDPEAIKTARDAAITDIEAAAKTAKAPLSVEANGSVPIGGVVAWPTDKPFDETKWRACDGGEAPIAGDEDLLFQAIGTTYGNAKNPTTHVKLPDFRGYFLRGVGKADSGPGQDADTSGRSREGVGSTQSGQVGDHTHDFSLTAAKVETKRVLQKQGDKDAHSCNDEPISGTTTPTAKLENRPMNIAVHWIIRVK